MRLKATFFLSEDGEPYIAALGVVNLGGELNVEGCLIFRCVVLRLIRRCYR